MASFLERMHQTIGELFEHMNVVAQAVMMTMQKVCTRWNSNKSDQKSRCIVLGKVTAGKSNGKEERTQKCTV